MSKASKTSQMLFMACAAGLFAVGRTVPAQAATNLLGDPDFEVADGGQDATNGDVPTVDPFGSPNGPWDGWNNWVAPYHGFYDNFVNSHPGTTIAAHSGSQVAKTFSSPNAGIYQNVTGAIAGDTYQGSGWFLNFSGDQITSPTTTCDVRLIFENSAGATLSTVVCPVPFGPSQNSPIDTWTQLTVSAVAPANTASVEWMAFMNNSAGSGAMFVDDAALFDLGSGPVTATWNGGGGDANWSDSSNWVGTTAPSATNILTFAGTTNLNPINSFPAGLQFNGVKFNSGAGAFNLTGNAINLGGDVVNNSTSLQTIGIGMTLLQNTNINAASGDVAIAGVISGGFGITKQGSGALTLSAANNYTGATTVSAGTLKVTANGSIASSSGVTVGTGGATPAGLTFLTGGNGLTTDTVAGLSLGSNGTVAIGTAISSASRSVLVTPSLNFAGSTGAWAGKVDLTNNDLIVQGGGAASLTAITNQLKQGFNAGAGYWNGAGGIVSSAAAGNNRFLTTVGSRLSSGSTFDGVATTTNDVLVKYTYYGDANLDGVVNGADYQQIDLGFGTGGSDWAHGDFNYDGVVNGSDFALIDNTFNQITATGASPLAVPAAITSSVPEPTSLGLIGVGAIGLMRRRRKDNR